MIRKGNVEAHKRSMLAAFAMSILFLTSYLIYHYYAGSVPFERTGWIRPVYFFILITHIVLAAILPFLALVTLWRAWERAVRSARPPGAVDWPIWMYVSVTGVLVYLMLYQL